MADPGSDPVALQSQLSALVTSIQQSSTDQLWQDVATIAHSIADLLRVRDGPVDNHTPLGQSDLPKTITSLCELALQDSPTLPDSCVLSIFELFRIAANVCMDHDANRARLLEEDVLKSTLSVLDGYCAKAPSTSPSSPLELSLDHLKTVRTAIGVLLNASIGFEPVHEFLLSNQAEVTILKISASVYPAGSWIRSPSSSDSEAAWQIRSDIANWSWRVIGEVKDEENNIFSTDIVPYLAAPLAAFTGPYPSHPENLSFDDDLRETLIHTDFELLEEACTLIEALSLDMEDFRLALARELNFPDEQGGVAGLTVLLNFIERGDYHYIWSSEERQRREKSFDICKAAIVKAVVEVAGEPKSEDVLWDDSEPSQPGGEFVARMVRWLSRYVDEADSSQQTSMARDDLAICASLALGNLSRREHHASILLSAPYDLAPKLASEHLLGSSADIRLKHSVLGFLKNLVHSSAISPSVHDSLYKAGIVTRICDSGVWDEKTDAMTDIVQLNAIGVVKHMANASIDSTLQLVLPSEGSSRPSGLKQILALVKRSDSVPIRSEGARVLVNVVKSLYTTASSSTYAVPASVSGEEKAEQQKKRDKGIKAVLVPESTSTLAKLVGRSTKYPVLVNEGLVALSLISTQPAGASLALDAILTPIATEVVEVPESSTSSDASSPVIATPTSSFRGRALPGTPLDMIISVLRNVDNPTTYPVEIRTNACSFMAQLTKNLPAEDLVNVKEVALPVVQSIYDEHRDAKGKEEMLSRAAKRLLDSWTT